MDDRTVEVIEQAGMSGHAAAIAEAITAFWRGTTELSSPLRETVCYHYAAWLLGDDGVDVEFIGAEVDE